MALTDFKPRKYQADLALRRFTFIEAHRRFGKSYYLTWLMSRQLVLPFSNRTLLYVAPYLKQVRQTCWDYFKQHLHGLSHIQFKSSEHLILNTQTNSRIILSGMKDATADSLRGLGAHFAVADELSGYSHDDFHSILLPIVAETRGTLILTGTPPVTYDLFLEQKNFHQQMAISQPDLYAFYSFPITVSGVFTKEEIEQLRMRSPSSFPREYMLDTDSGDETSFIPLRILEELTKRDPGDYIATQPPTCGWDVALKRDNSAYVIRHDHHVVAMGRLEGSPEQQVDKLYRIMRKHSCDILCYDHGGVGHAFDTPLERLCDTDIHLEVSPVDFQQRASSPSKFANARSEMYYRVQSWLYNEASVLPSASHPDPLIADYSVYLLEELGAQVIRPNDKNQFQLEPKNPVIKASIGRSCDFSDAFALSFAAGIGHDDVDASRNPETLDLQSLSPTEIMDLYPELYPMNERADYAY